MTELQLEIQNLWADKTMSFWCLIRQQSHARKPVKELAYYWIDASWDWQWKVSDSWNIKESECITIWHPITRWRLCYLYWSMPIQKRTAEVYEKFNAMQLHFILPDNTKLLNQTILERPEETQLLVRDFLLSIQ